ncbi:bifunctional diguanylate cyclase/phosphodiesterase [Aquisalimonas asiatica]|uniref:PAS domain S-box-containing protein/diguanylate cyclase (GGDEF) domain-containing protein n=1 Tax=Aquisalimonas asiatica TaxID=406100 RepID=A0A1H8UK02_9GAMM|nr:EAL domain-containing protein [Aquisalimonas asiatica]SEP03549.1 PAS domain S-box-containing protein/diguanylate cyclase (GGDEF) domain-containing protein [Aquisalimonas asiatica]
MDRELEEHGVTTTVHVMRGGQLRYSAGPAMPAVYGRILDNILPGERSGGCGLSALRGEPVFVDDAAVAACYSDFRDVVNALGFRATWSMPVLNDDGAVLGTVALHFQSPCKAPPAGVHEPMRRLVALVGTAIATHEWTQHHHGEVAGLQRHMQGSPIGCIEWGPDFRIRHCNEAAGRILGYLPDRLVGMEAGDFLLREDDRAGLTSVKRDLLSGGVRHLHTYARNRRQDGVPIWCEWFNLAVGDRHGGITGFLSLVKDVTESTLARRYTDRLARLPSTGSYLDHLIEQIRKVIGGDVALVASLEDDGRVARVLSSSFRDEGLELERYDLAGTPCESLSSQDVCVINQAVAQQYPNDPLLASMGAQSYAGVPLRDRSGSVFGHLAVLGRYALGPADALQSTLELAAARVGLEVQRQWSERETRLAALAFETYEAIMILDQEFQFVRVNTAFCNLTGYSAPAVMQRGLDLLLTGQDGARIRREIRETLSSRGYWQGEVWARGQQGQRRLYRMSISALQEPDERDARYVGSFLDVTWNREAEERIQRLTYEDGVTGLPNRAAFLSRLKREGSEATLDGAALLLLDLDGFRRVNEGMGYDMADSLLEIQSARLRGLVPGAVAIARVGADEFAVVLRGQDGRPLTEATLAKEAERLRRAFAHPVEASGTMVQSGASIGVATMDGSIHEPSVLLTRGEIAAAQARHQGGNCVAFFDPEMEQLAGERLGLERGLRQALRQGDVGFHLQPLVDAAGHVERLEVLARWEHKGEAVSPARFVPIAEASGLIRPLGGQVLRGACQYLAGLRGRYPGQSLPGLAVNVSVRQFHDPDFEALVEDVLSETGLPAGALLLEVTESLLAEEGDAVIRRMQRLRQMGVRFAIDDFGTGYSCLAYLRRLPIDELKIDGSFVDAMLLSPEDEEIVRTIIVMAHALRLNVVAERVETREQMVRLQELGCSTFQGFYFHRPIAPAGVTALLQLDPS